MKIFASILILSLIIFSNANVEAEDFQELKGRIMLPDRIRHRQDSHELTRPAPPRITVPSKKIDESSPRYTQRQPKKPPRLRYPSSPKSISNNRGSYPHKRFGPPRFRR